jgi:hypothetical protein
MSYIDTRDLIETRDELKQEILDSFLEDFPHYEEKTESFEDILFEEEEIESWKEDWQEELDKISCIDEIENEIGSEFDFGVTLISEDYFTDYTEDLLKDCGYISNDFPSWIEIDWEATAENVGQDYSELEYEGKTYLYRA